MTEQWKAIILDHYRNPRHYGELNPFSFASEQHNRTCGDMVKVFAAIDANGKARFSFTGAGCSLCLASASLMMELLQDQTLADARKVHDEFQAMWSLGAESGGLANWQALDGLRRYPVRSRCVKLSWQALEDIIRLWMAA